MINNIFLAWVESPRSNCSHIQYKANEKRLFVFLQKTSSDYIDMSVNRKNKRLNFEQTIISIAQLNQGRQFIWRIPSESVGQAKSLTWQNFVVQLQWKLEWAEFDRSRLESNSKTCGLLYFGKV